jgi:hypothetical protein
MKNLHANTNEFNKLFAEIDINKNGSVTAEELEALWDKHNMDKHVYNTIKYSFRFDADKKITQEGLIF